MVSADCKRLVMIIGNVSASQERKVYPRSGVAANIQAKQGVPYDYVFHLSVLTEFFAF